MKLRLTLAALGLVFGSAHAAPVTIFTENFEVFTHGYSLSGQGGWHSTDNHAVISTSGSEYPGNFGLTGRIAQISVTRDSNTDHAISGLNDFGILTAEYDLRVNGSTNYTYLQFIQTGLSFGVEYENFAMRGAQGGFVPHGLTGDHSYHIKMTIDPTAYAGAGSATVSYARYTAPNALSTYTTVLDNAQLNLNTPGKRLSDNSSIRLRMARVDDQKSYGRVDNISITQEPLPVSLETFSQAFTNDGSPQTLAVKFSNAGKDGQPLDITGLTLSGPDAGFFTTPAVWSTGVASSGDGTISLPFDSANGGEGLYNVTLEIHSNAVNSPQSIPVQVEVTLPSAYESWASDHGYWTPGTANTGPDDDFDGDGVDNKTEHAFGLDPTDSSSANPVKNLDMAAGQITYTRRDPVLSNMSYGYESSTTLEAGSWKPFTPVSETVLGGAVQTVTATLPAALQAHPKLFVRMVATPSPPGFHADTTVYVDPSGDDANPGKAEAPLATLAAALEAVRLRNESSGGTRHEKTTILVRPGHYPLQDTLQLTGAHSNTTVWATGPGVVIHGGREIAPANISKVTDPRILNQLIEPGARQKLWVADLHAEGITDYGQIGPRGFGRGSPISDLRLSVGGQSLYPAQWPNKGELGFQIGTVTDPGGNPRGGGDWNHGGTFHYAHDRISQWANSSDAWLHGFFHHGYADDLIGIESINTASKTIKMKHAAFYSIVSGQHWNKVRGIHILAEIDQPGEFFIDRANGRCYFIPPEGVDPQTNPVLAPVMATPLLALNDCVNVTFSGITFEQTRGTGITVENGARNRFVGCIVRSTGRQGIIIQGQDGPLLAPEGSMQHAITDCDIYNTGTGGITLAGGNRSKLRPAGNLVSNSHIHHNNMVDKTYCPAIRLSGVGNMVRNCDIHDILGAAVLFSGNDNILEFNNIYNAMTFGDDMGVCYTGRSITSFGNKIRSNYIHDCGHTPNVSNVYTIYLDDGACGTQVYNNIFRRSAKAQVFLIGGGSYNRVYGNVSIDNPVFMRVGNRLTSWASHLLAPGGMFRNQFDAVLAAVPPWSTAYPELARYWQEDPKTPQNLMRDNLLVRGQGELSGDRSWVQGNVSIQTYPANGVADWSNTQQADQEISSYGNSLANPQIPSLHQTGLQPGPWRDSENSHLADE